MASEIDIVNIAYSHIGQRADVNSIRPPDQSVEAQLAARFYPIARDALLEMGSWGFATRRVSLTPIDSQTTSWTYCYLEPADCLQLLAILDPMAQDDYGGGPSLVRNDYLPSQTYSPPASLSPGRAYEPQPFDEETLPDGRQVIYTDQPNAVLRYVTKVTDTTKFSPLFTVTLGWYLASMLAGPIIKGDAGAAEAKRCEMMAFGQDGKSGWFGKAMDSDASQRRVLPIHSVAWITGRN